MARYYLDKKTEANFFKKISIFWLRKEEKLNGLSSTVMTWTDDNTDKQDNIGIVVNIFEDYVRLTYTQTNQHTKEIQNFDYKIQLTTTPCNYGGKRYWFICPLNKDGVLCNKRVAMLYKGGDYFGCRHCYNITYKSRNLKFIMTSEPELEKLEQEIKREYYNGKMTRKYKSFLKKEMRDNSTLAYAANRFGKLSG